MKRSIIFIFCIFLILFACSIAPENEIRPVIGPRTVEVEEDTYQTIFYVQDEKGSDESGDGSIMKP